MPERGSWLSLEGLRRLLDRGLSSLGATFPHLPSSSTPSLQTPKSDWTLVAFPETFIRHVTQFSPYWVCKDECDRIPRP